MIEKIIEWSIRNRLLVILASLALAIGGVRALVTMPVDAIPDLSENQVIVFTDWMGRSPRRSRTRSPIPSPSTFKDWLESMSYDHRANSTFR